MKPPADRSGWPVYADWLEERGERSSQWRLFEVPGYGQFTQFQEGKIMPVVGKRMLIFCGLSFAFCGDVAEQTGPFTFRLDNASMVVRTGGTPWDDLARGKGREAATFRKYGTIHVGPQFSFSCEWVGDLP